MNKYFYLLKYHIDKRKLSIYNYKVGPWGGDGSLEENTTYTDWNWILVRNKSDEKWQLKTWGY